MNSEDAFRADGKSGARGTCDGWGMRYRCGALHGQGEHLDRIRREAVCCDPGAGVPLKVAVPLLLGTNVTPPGKLPVKLRVVFG